MVFVETPNTAKVELVMSWDGEICENVLEFEGAGAWDIASLTTLCDQVGDWWFDNIRPLQVPNVSNAKIVATDQSSSIGPRVEFFGRTGDVGSDPGTTTSRQVSMTVKFLTALRGRSYRGRNYFIGIPEVVVTSSVVSAVYSNSIVAAYELLATAITVNSAQHVVVSRFAAGTARASGVTTPVVAYGTDSLVKTQRRRLNG